MPSKQNHGPLYEVTVGSAPSEVTAALYPRCNDSGVVRKYKHFFLTVQLIPSVSLEMASFDRKDDFYTRGSVKNIIAPVPT